MVNELIAGITSFLRRNIVNIIEHEGETEPQLLKSIQIDTTLNLIPVTSSIPALFGYPKLKTDYYPSDDETTVIEIKRLGLISNRTNKIRENECDFKNGLAQILEQAQCRSAQNAILVIIDGGRGSDRPLNPNEEQYINNISIGFSNLNLYVIRARIVKNPQQIDIEIIRPNRTHIQSG